MDSTELRKMKNEDAKELYELIDGNREYLRKWLAWVDCSTSEEDAARFIHSCLQAEADGSGDHYFIFKGQSIRGTIGLREINKKDRTAVIGYWIDERHQSEGIVSHYCRQLTKELSQKHKLSKIYLRFAQRNLGSRRVAEKSGYRFLRMLPDAETVNGNTHDLVVYVYDNSATQES